MEDRSNNKKSYYNKEQKRQYYLEHRDKIKERYERTYIPKIPKEQRCDLKFNDISHEQIICDICGGKYTYFSRQVHRNRNKHKMAVQEQKLQELQEKLNNLINCH